MRVSDADFDGYRKLHVRLWTWMAKKNFAFKIDWPGWKSEDRLVRAAESPRCFACPASGKDCRHCPIRWTDAGTGAVLRATTRDACQCLVSAEWLALQARGDAEHWRRACLRVARKRWRRV